MIVQQDRKQEKDMFRLKLSMQHTFNPLHLYCRLCPILGRKTARAFTQRYQTLYRKVL